ncbi:hypothetical protein [Frigoribacterium sp. PhB118]|uniref:hypothetical protein n=1 Tax=Frigoribacterium sp. PhB118 TaxID=2485175 RepID=UPI000F4AD134|nr:hypothetical protein [Frigoribacterium sp. PhB118]
MTKSPVPPPRDSTEFSLQRWESHRDRGINPTFHSGYVADRQNRVDFLRGAELYGLHLDPDAALDAPNTIKPQQLQIVDTLSGDFDIFDVEIPRRASKTTTIFLLLIGRCANRPGYQVAFSAQSGVAGTRRLREWKTRLDRINPPDDQDLPPWMRTGRSRTTKAQERRVALFGDDLLPERAEEAGPARRGFRILMGETGKGIYFDNGSQFLVFKPDADAVRGEAADVAWIDEAQEVDPDEGDELLAGLLPLMDTKPGAHLILSGTSGEVRVGPFWRYLALLREGGTDIGGLDFAADPSTPWELLETEESAMELLQRVHPGIGTLTTIEKMRKNYRALPLPQWAREYLSMWPETFGSTAIAADLWTAGALEKKLTKPPRIAFGLAIKPGGGVAAIVAAWRGTNGQAYIEVVNHQGGTDWLPKRMQELTKTYRGSSIAYDDIAEGKATAGETQVLTPRPRLQLQTYRETAAGCIQIMRDLERGTLRHFDQIGLNAAVAVVAKRETRGDNGVWLWTPSEPGADITCIDAATRALRNWDQHFARSTNRTGVVTAA